MRFSKQGLIESVRTGAQLQAAGNPQEESRQTGRVREKEVFDIAMQGARDTAWIEPAVVGGCAQDHSGSDEGELGGVPRQLESRRDPRRRRL